MQIVIEIDDKLYEIIKNPKKLETMYHAGRLCKAVNSGKVLPKGHGRLIDADAFIAMMGDASKRQKYKELLIDDRLTVDDVFKAVIASMLNQGITEGDAPTIIEADRSEEE